MTDAWRRLRIGQWVPAVASVAAAGQGKAGEVIASLVQECAPIAHEPSPDRLGS